MIETKDLKLLPLTFLDLKELKKGRKFLETRLGLNHNEFELAQDLEFELSEALDFWLVKSLRYPKEYKWYTNWEIILKSENISVGGAGFMGPPDKDGSVSIGYMLDSKFRNKGLCTSAINVLCKWAFTSQDCRQINADTRAENAASERVLTKNGFTFYKEGNGIRRWIRLPE